MNFDLIVASAREAWQLGVTAIETQWLPDMDSHTELFVVSMPQLNLVYATRNMLHSRQIKWDQQI